MPAKKASPKTKFPKKIYIARYNLSGLYSSKPLAAFLQKDEGLGYPQWWHRGGDLGTSILGLEVAERCITFASETEQDVQNFIHGILAVACVEESRLPSGSTLLAFRKEHKRKKVKWT